MDEIREKHYRTSELEVRWFVIGGGADGMPVVWRSWELDDCIEDLVELGRNLINELDQRYRNSFSDLNVLLSKCLDFVQLIKALCGTKTQDEVPIDKRKYLELGAAEFQ